MLNRNETGVAPAWGLPQVGQCVVPILVVALVLGITVGRGNWPYAMLAIAGGCALLWPVQVGLGIFALLISFDFIAVAGTGRDATGLTFLAGSAAASLLLVKGLVSQRLQAPSKAALWWVAFVVWATITTAWAPNLQMSVARLPTAWSLLLFYLVAACFRIRREEFFWTVALAILGGLCAAAYASVGFYTGLNFEGQRATLMIGQSEADPNYFAAGLLFPLSLAIAAFLSSRGWKRAVLLLAILLLSFALLLSMSRGALVALVVMAIVYFRRLHFKWTLLIPIASAASVLAFLPSTFFQRLSNAVETRGAHRLDIWLIGWAAAKHHGIVGAGLGNFSVVFNNYLVAAHRFSGYSKFPHNIYLEQLVELGIVGLGLFGLATLTQLREAKAFYGTAVAAGVSQQLSHLVLACEVSCWGLLACGFFLGLLWFKLFWFAWIMLALGARLLRPL